MAAISRPLALQRRSHDERRVRVALHHVDLRGRLPTLLLHSHLLRRLLPLRGLRLPHLLRWLLPMHGLRLPHGWLLHLLHWLMPLHDELPHGRLLHWHLHALPSIELLLLLLAILEAIATTAIATTTTASIAPAKVLVVVLSPEGTIASLVPHVATAVAACVVRAANRLATATFSTTCTESTLLLLRCSLTPLPRLRSPGLSKLLLEQLILLLQLSH